MSFGPPPDNKEDALAALAALFAEGRAKVPSVGVGQGFTAPPGAEAAPFVVGTLGPRKRTPSQIAKGSSAKGAKAERDVLGAFRDVMRNVEEDLNAQGFEFVARSGFATRKRLEKGTSNRDLGNIPLISIEVKRREKLAISEWWAQAARQADQGELPVLVYRQNNEAWRVRTWVALTDPHAAIVDYVQAETSLPDFLAYYAKLYRQYLLGVLT